MGNFSWILIVPILAVLVVVHEFGHFLTARFFGVKVEEFGIGLPPRIIGREWKGTLWSLNWIPLGGFARMKDENTAGEAPDSFQSKPAYARAIILLGGIVFNLVFASILFIAVLAIYGTPTGQAHIFVGAVKANAPAQAAGWQTGDQIVRVSGTAISSVDDLDNTIGAAEGHPVNVDVLRGGQTVPTMITPLQGIAVGDVSANTPAQAAGWQPDDRILRVGNTEVRTRSDLTNAVNMAAGQVTQVDLARGNQTITTMITPRKNPPPGQGALGITLITGVGTNTGVTLRQQDTYQREPLLQAIPDGFAATGRGAGAIFGFLGQLIRGTAPGGIAGNVSGPIGIAQAIGEAVSTSPVAAWVTVLNLTALISINLAVFNLLPIPALDGGRLLFVLIEIVRRGRRVPPEREGMVHVIGMAVLLSIFVLVAFLDIQRIFDGRSILPR